MLCSYNKGVIDGYIGSMSLSLHSHIHHSSISSLKAHFYDGYYMQGFMVFRVIMFRVIIYILFSFFLSYNAYLIFFEL